MNTIDTTIASDLAPVTTSAACIKILHVADILGNVKSLNQAIFMAAESLQDRGQMDAILSVADIVDDKLVEILGKLEEIMGEI